MTKSDANALPSLSRVIGYIAVKHLCPEDRVRILARLGYGNAEIAMIAGVTRSRVAAINKKPPTPPKRAPTFSDIITKRCRRIVADAKAKKLKSPKPKKKAKKKAK